MSVQAQRDPAAVAADTMTLASLASDTNLVAGRESTAVHHTTEIDSLIQVSIMTGTTPTTGKVIEIWAYASLDGTNFTGSATGADANLTPSEKSLMVLLGQMVVDGTSNKAYTSRVYSMAQAFGGTLPEYTGIYVVQNTGAALNATGGNHFVKRVKVNYKSTP